MAAKQGPPGLGGFLGGVLDVRVMGRLQFVPGGFKPPGVLFAATLKPELPPFLGPFQRGSTRLLQHLAGLHVLAHDLGDPLVFIRKVLNA